MIDISSLAQTGPCKKFAAGQRVPCPGGGDSGREMYILLSGRVEVFRASAAGGTQKAGTLLPGDVFGGREFFTDSGENVYTAGADSVVYAISIDSFDELSWTRPDILFEILKAAYMPFRKVPASAPKKTAMKPSAREPAAMQKTENKPEVKAGAAPAVKTKIEQPKEPTAHKDNSALFMMMAESGIFPEGHKLYPGITKPEYAQLVFAKDYECPYCRKPFTDFKVFRSKLYEASPVRFDLRRYYNEFQTEWYDVITCQNCLFSTFHNYYTESKPIQRVKINNELAAIRASIMLDFEAERDIDFVFATHYIALICSEGYLSLGKQIRAKLWGNLSWLYEDVKDDEMAKFAAGKAAEAYEAIYAETHLTPVQEQITCLSIAGMQYRAGVDKNLKKYLFTAKTVKMGDSTYAKIAEDFMYDLGVSGV